MNSATISQVQTKEDRDLFLQSIQALQETEFEKKGAFEEALKNELPLKFSANLVADLQASQLPQDQFFENLKKELDRLQVISLTIAFEPQQKTINRLHEWLINNVAKNIIIDLNIDHSIAGGVIIAYQGQYKDFSLRTQIKDFFEKNQTSLINLIKAANV